MLDRNFKKHTAKKGLFLTSLNKKFKIFSLVTSLLYFSFFRIPDTLLLVFTPYHSCFSVFLSYFLLSFCSSFLPPFAPHFDPLSFNICSQLSSCWLPTLSFLFAAILSFVWLSYSSLFYNQLFS